jgi:hypothetical protein
VSAPLPSLEYAWSFQGDALSWSRQRSDSLSPTQLYGGKPTAPYCTAISASRTRSSPFDESKLQGRDTASEPHDGQGHAQDCGGRHEQTSQPDIPATNRVVSPDPSQYMVSHTMRTYTSSAKASSDMPSVSRTIPTCLSQAGTFRRARADSVGT